MILVTGGTGLVGSYLVRQLVSQGENVVVIHRKMSDLDRVKHVFSYFTDTVEALFNHIQWIEADLLDIPSLSKAFKGITQVYHCAALISFDSSDYKEMRKVNIEGTANIVNLCISNSIQKLCFVSSVAAVGKPTMGTKITEENEWNVEDNNYGYAITKYGAEMEVWRASQEGVPVVIVNPGVILGAGFWHNGSGELFSKIYKGFPFYTEGVTGFVAVKDVVNIMIQLMQSTIINERYILVSENVSFKAVFYAMADNFNKKRPFVKVSKLMSGIVWRLNWLSSLITRKSPLITKHSAKSSHNKYNYSNAKIKKELGYKFESLSDTIKNVCNSYLKDI